VNRGKPSLTGLWKGCPCVDRGTRCVPSVHLGAKEGFSSVIIHARKHKEPWPAECARSNNSNVLNFPLNMPADAPTLNAIAEALRNVSNVVAVVLGGSYARGLGRPDSDIDIRIYDRAACPVFGGSGAICRREVLCSRIGLLVCRPFAHNYLGVASVPICRAVARTHASFTDQDVA
jgi:nucleotidyltransferase-like protein